MPLASRSWPVSCVKSASVTPAGCVNWGLSPLRHLQSNHLLPRVRPHRSLIGGVMSPKRVSAACRPYSVDGSRPTALSSGEGAPNLRQWRQVIFLSCLNDLSMRDHAHRFARSWRSGHCSRPPGCSRPVGWVWHDVLCTCAVLGVARSTGANCLTRMPVVVV